MPDDLRIPDVAHDMGMRERAPLSNDLSPYGASSGGGYRPRRIGAGPGLGVVKLAAGGIGGILLLGAVGYSVLGRHSSAVPVIEADSRPIRVKPDNPGGMQIAGADELTLSDDRTSRDGMAPAAEVPAPQALRAQMQQAAPAFAPAAATNPATTAPAAPQVAAASPAQPMSPVAPSKPQPPAPFKAATGATPLPDTPSQSATKPPPPAAATAPKEAAKPTNGATMVQLGALSTEAAARTEWQRLAHSQPGLLDGHEPTITKVERDGRTYWRLRTGGFSDIADATGFCGKLKAKGGSCAIASF